MFKSVQENGQGRGGSPEEVHMQLKKCTNKACKPVEQTRGSMSHGDYVDVIKAHEHVTPGPSSAVNMKSSHDLHLIIDNEEDNKTDRRVCCLTCGKATGWQRRDAPGMPGVGIEFTHKTWNGVIDGDQP
jgi:hypothetical protein